MIKTCDKILAMDVETVVPGHGPGRRQSRISRDARLFRLDLAQRRGALRIRYLGEPCRSDIDLGKYKT
jgi:glyoxylase-like metal-dependent hydrolase (beta-lactamase superfamily II)